MNSKEIVDGFLKKRAERLKKFVICQGFAEVIEIAISVYAILKFKDTEYLTYVCYAIAAIMLLTVYIGMGIYHLAFSKTAKSEGPLAVIYNKEKVKLDKVQKAHKKGKIDELTLLEAQKSFDKSIDDLAEKIKSLDIKD